MSTTNITTTQPRSILRAMAERFGMEADKFERTLRATVVPKDCTVEEFAAFLLVAKEYDLNPITREIYAFPKRGGGIQPIVGIDGWMSIINDRPEFDGMEFEDNIFDGTIESITCRIFRKDRSHPTAVTEYLAECKQDTATWKKWPARMLRHKAAIQCARYAFGFSGIIDPDEYERMPSAYPATSETVVPSKALRSTPGNEKRQDHDPETGEVEEVPEAVDRIVYMRELEGAMAKCNTPEALSELWQGHVSMRSVLSKGDQKLAEEMLDRHRIRLEVKG